MGVGAGKELLLKIERSATPGTFDTLGGLRSKSLSINNEAIDVTNHGSNQWKTSLDAAGIRSMSASGSGVFEDDTYLAQAQADCLAGTLRKFQIIDAATGDKFEGYFKITSMEIAGEYNAERNWSISLESSGEIVFTAA